MRVGIVGLGLIGGSMAKAFHAAGRDRVLAFDRDRSMLDFALLSGAVDEALTEEKLPTLDLLLVALYPEAAIAYLESAAPHLRRDALVLDTCGTKRLVCAAGFRLAERYGFAFVGGHPMAGKEKGGFDNADAALFEGACYILTPTPSTPAAVVDGMKELAAQLGVDLVVTDHHLPPRQLPKAVAVVDPMRTDDESPYKGFSGAGVAFKLCCALDGCPPEELLDFCGDLAAIGTVADVMDLTGENRTLVRRGLEALQNSGRPGIEALLEVSGMGGRTVTADTVSYTLAPRLNAAGRMDSAALALQRLLCEDAERAADLAARLNQCNQDRQNAEQEILARVNEQLDADPARKNDRVLVVWGDAFHPGVTGIVKSMSRLSR